MPRKWRKLLRYIVPPAWSTAYLNRFHAVRYVGNYATWRDAQAEAQGYDAAHILAQVTQSARRVRDGRAAFERDGVAFIEPAYNWPLLACLLREAHKHDGTLRVLDFGGSLGSVYFQHRRWLQNLETRWAVVEQPGFVEVGRREFSTDVLSFHAAIADAVRAIEPTVALFSAVLAWIPEPRLPLDQVMAARIPAILIDRTPLTPQAHDVAKVQHVPPSIYKASYPCWFLSRTRFMAILERNYQLEAELPQHDPQVEEAVFAGLYFTIRP